MIRKAAAAMTSKPLERDKTMKRIEQEIDRTLNCLGDADGIEVSGLFIETVSSKVNGLRGRRGPGYRSKAFYPVVIVLMVVFNLAVLAAVLVPQTQTTQTVDPMSAMASEYGIGSAYASL